ncbi:hypothetical protein DFJ73DRAFT_856153 [Zopfochytrium polystomum]|nr:hypothetical protein DFJ73DRAFT_856153 [Zopfochytrium polystomum]
MASHGKKRKKKERGNMSSHQQENRSSGNNGFHRSLRIDLPKSLKDLPHEAIRSAFPSQDAQHIKDIRNSTTLRKDPFVYINLKNDTTPNGFEAKYRGKPLAVVFKNQRHELYVFDERTMGVKMEVAETLSSLKDQDLKTALLVAYPSACDAAVRRYPSAANSDSMSTFSHVHVFVNFRSPADAETARSMGELFITVPSLSGSHRVRALPRLNWGGGENSHRERSRPFRNIRVEQRRHPESKDEAIGEARQSEAPSYVFVAKSRPQSDVKKHRSHSQDSSNASKLGEKVALESIVDSGFDRGDAPSETQPSLQASSEFGDSNFLSQNSAEYASEENSSEPTEESQGHVVGIGQDDEVANEGNSRLGLLDVEESSITKGADVGDTQVHVTFKEDGSIHESGYSTSSQVADCEDSAETPALTGYGQQYVEDPPVDPSHGQASSDADYQSASSQGKLPLRFGAAEFVPAEKPAWQYNGPKFGAAQQTYLPSNLAHLGQPLGIVPYPPYIPSPGMVNHPMFSAHMHQHHRPSFAQQPPQVAYLLSNSHSPIEGSACTYAILLPGDTAGNMTLGDFFEMYPSAIKGSVASRLSRKEAHHCEYSVQESLVKLTFTDADEATRACSGGFLAEGKFFQFGPSDDQDDLGPHDSVLRLYLPADFDAELPFADVLDIFALMALPIRAISIRASKNKPANHPARSTVLGNPVILVAFQSRQEAEKAKGMQATLRGFVVTLTAVELVSELYCLLSDRLLINKLEQINGGPYPGNCIAPRTVYFTNFPQTIP